MINGAHTIVYTKDAAAARAFFRDVLNFPAVDAGQGWLIFALPPGELAAHPAEGNEGTHQLYLMCDDIKSTVAGLKAKGVKFTSPITDHGWGLLTSFAIPGGGELSIYEARHPRPEQARPSAAPRRATKGGPAHQSKPATSSGRAKKSKQAASSGKSGKRAATPKRKAKRSKRS